MKNRILRPKITEPGSIKTVDVEDIDLFSCSSDTKLLSREFLSSLN